METSRSLEAAALEAIIASQANTEMSDEQGNILVTGTPFVLSQTGEGIMVYGKIEHEHVSYYLGTVEN